MKTCTKCKVEREVTEFAFRDKELGKRHQICKSCNSGNGKAHYERYKDYYKKKARRQDLKARDEIQNKMLEFLSKQACADCFESDPVVLEFDHVKEGKKKTVSAHMSGKSSWNTILEEISKCEVVCANCHRRRTYLRCNSYRIRDIG